MPYRGATEIVKNIKQNKLFGIWIGRFLLSFFLCIIMARVDPAILFGDCTFLNVIYTSGAAFI